MYGLEIGIIQGFCHSGSDWSWRPAVKPSLWPLAQFQVCVCMCVCDFPLWPLRIHLVILLSRHTFFFFSFKCGWAKEGLLSAFLWLISGSNWREEIANESEGVGINSSRPSGFWVWQVSNQDDALGRMLLPLWSLKTLMTNPKGIADKTFTVVYSIQGSRRPWSPNGNTQYINIVLISIVCPL